MFIREAEFRAKLVKDLTPFRGKFKSVMGPGRSGAIAAVYASYFLGVPFLPYGIEIPQELTPLLLVDTASMSGKTLRKAQEKTNAALSWAFFKEPPRVKFWYETMAIK